MSVHITLVVGRVRQVSRDSTGRARRPIIIFGANRFLHTYAAGNFIVGRTAGEEMQIIEIFIYGISG